MYVLKSICDAIFGNHFEVKQVTFPFLYLFEILIKRGTFCCKPLVNRTSGFKVISNWMILKTIEKKKEMHSFYWLYLTINAPDFRLIPLDRNTYKLTSIYHCVVLKLSFYNYYPLVKQMNCGVQRSPRRQIS